MRGYPKRHGVCRAASFGGAPTALHYSLARLRVLPRFAKEKLIYSICTPQGCSIGNERSPHAFAEGFSYGWAATYFPTGCRSIIGTAGLNFSVRNGKRCAPASQPPRVSFQHFGGRRKDRGMRIAPDSRQQHPHSREREPSPGLVGRTGARLHAQAFGQLVPLGSTCRHASTCGLSTCSSGTAL